jgi:hypothetical protein
MTGSSTHGASIIGSVSDEMAPSVVSTRGDSANATAAITRDVGLPMPNASATRSSPQNPTTSSNAHHSRWVIQPGTFSMSPSRKKVPCGKRYPYAWFCAWPNGNSLFHRLNARVRNRSGLAVRSSLVSGEICPGDWANVRISAAAAATHNQRRGTRLTSVAVLNPVEHR